MKLSKKSKNKILLIGNNLSSSKSAEMHNSIYEYFDLPFYYEIKEFESNDYLRNFLNENKNIIANVTYPYKREILDLVDNKNMDEATSTINGTNLIIQKSNRCFFFNYDGIGFVKSLFSQDCKTFEKIKNSNCVVFGTGITAHSIKYALELCGAYQVDLIQRENNCFSQDTQTKIDASTFVFNATPVGKFSENKNLNLMQNYNFCSNQIAVDVVYRNDITPFLQQAQSQNAIVFDGRWMLAGQAALSIIKICELQDIDTPKSFNFDTIFKVAFQTIQNK